MARRLTAREKQELLRRAERGDLYADIADDLGCTYQCVSKIALANGIRRGMSHAAKPFGATKVNSKGYVEIKLSEVAYDWMLEHRLVMERQLGRPLRDDEVVHHRNGNQTDNAPENLEVMSPSEHSQHHHGLDEKELRARRREHVRCLQRLRRRLGRTPTQSEVCEATGQLLPQLLDVWRTDEDGTPYADAAERLYRAAGMKKRSRGAPGHVS